MTEEEKVQAQEPQTEPEPAVEQEGLTETDQKRETAGEEQARNHLAEKRGRMVVAGVLAAVVLSVIAVLVGGIFQVTSRWLAPCPADLSVNDPAPILWKSIESDQSPPAAPGVPKELAEQVGWKGSPPGGK